MKKKTALTLGLAVGTGLGMMYAPKKGKDLREDVKNKAKDLTKKVKKVDKKDIKETVEDALNRLKQELEELINETDKNKVLNKADEITNELESIIKSSHDQKDSLIEKSATKLKETALKKTKEIVEKLENNSKI